MKELPEKGFVFWPVGCGDSTTVVIDDGVVLQIDLRHAESAEKEDDPKVAIIDELVKLLPKKNGKPFLPAFGVTHLDKDHISGFEEFLSKVTIGDLWFTPRVLWEQDQDELCDDAKAFVKEAERRINKLKADGKVGSGDRIRIIGFSKALEEHSDIYKNLPEGSVTMPGSEFTSIDGEDYADHFRAFVHAPFKEDAEAERNRTSFALQVTLKDGDNELRALIFGDLAYKGLRQIFDRSKDDDLSWDLFLAPHHCSKSVMYAKDEEKGETEESLKQDLLDDIEEAACDGAYIIASSPPIPAKDKEGANPPHRVAADRYRELIEDGHFVCTGDHPNAESPEPVVFEFDGEGYELRKTAEAKAVRKSRVPSAIEAARGATRPPQAAVGFGRRRT
jgi:beta-lactamase superfamily II metal-dependent hydrolase